MSLGEFLLQEGMEIDLDLGLREVVAFLDAEVPLFSHDGFGYRMAPAKSVLGRNWKLHVRPWSKTLGAELATIGLVEVSSLEGGGARIRIRAKTAQTSILADGGDLFTSFVIQLLNSLKGRGLLELPGRLPTR